MAWTIKSEHPFGAEGCTCQRGRGERGCPLHRREHEQRQKGCSCWAGYSMPDGSLVDPACAYCYPSEDVDDPEIPPLEDDRVAMMLGLVPDKRPPIERLLDAIRTRGKSLKYHYDDLP